MSSSPQTGGQPALRKVPRKRVRLLYEHRISLYSFLVALPGIAVSGILIWLQPWSTESKFAFSFLGLLIWWFWLYYFTSKRFDRCKLWLTWWRRSAKRIILFVRAEPWRMTRWASFRSKSMRWQICSRISASEPSRQQRYCGGSSKKSTLPYSPLIRSACFDW
jgi:uncharacterized membrane protein